MLVAVSAFGPQPDSEVNPRLGRCEHFVLYDTATGEYSAFANTGRLSPGASGIATAGLLNDHQVQAVITGNVGPNAYTALEAAGIKVYIGVGGTVQDVTQKLQKGLLTEAKSATAGPHGSGR